MTFKSPLRLSVFVAAVLAFAGVASAQGTKFDASTTYSNLAMTATVQTALNLEISTNVAGVAVTGTAGSGAYGLDFGNVNGLGLGTPKANVTKTAPQYGAITPRWLV